MKCLNIQRNFGKARAPSLAHPHSKFKTHFSSFFQVHEDPKHKSDHEKGRHQLLALPRRPLRQIRHVHEHHSGYRQAASATGSGVTDFNGRSMVLCLLNLLGGLLGVVF